MKYVVLEVQELRHQHPPHDPACKCAEEHISARNAMVATAAVEGRDVTKAEHAAVKAMLVKEPGHYGERTPYGAPVQIVRMSTDNGRSFGERLLSDGSPYETPLHEFATDPAHETLLVGRYMGEKLPWMAALEADFIKNEQAHAEMNAAGAA